ncbi:MAG: hypothetical protein ABSD97_07355 [Acidimicrobiales bacterium]|jgi:hypothetical protein
MRRALILVFIAGAIANAFLLPASSAQAGRPAAVAVSLPRVLTCTGTAQLKPASYLMSCADANASWKKVVWTSWGSKSARGKGDLYQNDCTPNCAAGVFRTYAAAIVLSGVMKTNKYGPLYSKASFSYSVAGKHESETFGLAT